MRLLYAMTPAKSKEEAAMTPAGVRTLAGGAALKSVRSMPDKMETIEMTLAQQNTAAEGGRKDSAAPRRRSALRHVLERQF